MSAGQISFVAGLVVVSNFYVADSFSLNGFVRSAWGSQRSTRAVSAAAPPSMVASAPGAKTMTREEMRKQERLENERRRKYVTPPEQYAHVPDSAPMSEHLIGEEMVHDDESASRLADRCIAEAERLFASEEGWTKVLEEDGIFVESKDVHGPYLKSGVRIVRGLGAIDADPETFYNFQVRIQNAMT